MSYFPSTQLTDAGRGLLIKSLSGECAIEFTKVGIGKGSLPADISALTSMQNMVKSVAINSISNEDEGAELSVIIDNTSVSEGFFWTELGIFATDPDDGEILYAYTHNGGLASYIPDHTTFSNFRINLSIIVTVGDAENVTAVIGQYAGYAPQADLDNHVNDTDNPHNVTKEQVGLGNVENYIFGNQPVAIGTSTLSQINSGESTSIIFGKIKAWIAAIASHFTASNPHSITPSKIGAATSAHMHSASEINSGVLPVSRGGTGSINLDGFAQSVMKSFFEHGNTVPNSSKTSGGVIDVDFLMDAGFYFINASNGAAIGGPTGAQKFYLLVLGDGRSACNQIALIPALYKSSASLPSILIREINVNSSSWSPWTTII